jgi:rhodanese-related sulfurtransferase
MATVEEITPTEFLDRWPDFRRGGVTLVDVREPHEHDSATLLGSTNIPMADVPHRLQEIDRNRPVVVICHSGIRSMKIANFLAHRGFEEIFNLTGGIVAWSAELGGVAPAADAERR